MGPAPQIMLASTIKEPPLKLIERLQDSGDWYFEIKQDGVRALVERNARGAVSITSRSGQNLTPQFPEIEDQLQGLDFAGILDGEIVVMDTNGNPSFPQVNKRAMQQNASTIRRMSLMVPAMFVPFDVLRHGLRDITGETYVMRRARLEELMSADDPEHWLANSTEGKAMWDHVILGRQMEGLVAKLGHSAYTPGRSSSWVKIKYTSRLSVLVCGYEPPHSASGIGGSLQMALWDAKSRTIELVGKVGSGLTQTVFDQIRQDLTDGQHVVIEVEYLNVSPTGQLRMPVFKGRRSDLALTEANTDQIMTYSSAKEPGED